MEPLEHNPLRSVVLVTGKGGVGKTTVAAGLARSAADRDGAAVLLEFADGEAGRRVLEGGPPGPGSIEHVVVEPQRAIETMSVDLFRSALLAKVVTSNFAMKRLFRAAPALRELAQLEAVRKTAELHPGVRVVVDMPATGHGIAWLRVPHQMKDLLVSGPLQSVAARLTQELVAPDQCSIAIVTLPEKLVLKETLELCGAVQTEVGLEPARLIVNRVPAEMPRLALREARRLHGTGGQVGQAAQTLAEVIAARAASRDEALGVLREATGHHELKPVLLPLAAADPAAGDVARWLEAEGAA